MTTGHKHRMMQVKQNGLVDRLARTPLYCTNDIAKVDRSPYPYGPCESHEGYWYLSALSILHRWTGLTLWFPDPEEKPDDD